MATEWKCSVCGRKIKVTKIKLQKEGQIVEQVEAEDQICTGKNTVHTRRCTFADTGNNVVCENVFDANKTPSCVDHPLAISVLVEWNPGHPAVLMEKI